MNDVDDKTLDELERLHKAATQKSWAIAIIDAYETCGSLPGDGHKTAMPVAGFAPTMRMNNHRQWLLDGDDATLAVHACNALSSLIAQCRNEIRWRAMLRSLGTTLIEAPSDPQNTTFEHWQAYEAALDVVKAESIRIANEQGAER